MLLALALALALAIPAHAQPQDETAAPLTPVEESAEPLFLAYPELDSAQTLRWLARLEGDPAQAARVAAISDALATPGTQPDDISREVTDLLHGVHEAQEDAILDAVLRDYAEVHLLDVEQLPTAAQITRVHNAAWILESAARHRRGGKLHHKGRVVMEKEVLL